MTETVITIGTAPLCRRIDEQLDLLTDRPRTLGWVLTAGDRDSSELVLGTLDDLETIVAEHQPETALVCLPAVMADQIRSIRTRLRKLGVTDRFMPTLEDQLAGIGPRTHVDVDPLTLLGRTPRTIDHDAVASVIAGQRVLITGAGGSIGSELALLTAGHAPDRLILVERSENALFEIDRQIARRHPDLDRRAVLHDVVDADGTLAIFREHQPDVIFHAAAHKHVPMMEVHPGAAVDNNLYGTKAAADAAALIGAKRFVLISTDKAVHPSSVMGASKRLAELYVQYLNRRYDTAFTMVRFGNVLGSSGSVLEIWSKQIADGGPITVTDPRMTRFFMSIPEAAALVVQSAAFIRPGAAGADVFVLNMGEPIRIVDLAKRLIEAHGLTAIGPEDTTATPDPTAHGTIRIVCTGARPGEKLHEQLATADQSLLPTKHPDIDVWLIPAPNPSVVEQMIDQLSPRNRPADHGQFITLVHELADPPSGTSSMIEETGHTGGHTGICCPDRERSV